MTTVLQILEDAMVDAGLLMEGASATADQRAKNLRRLNDILELWQTQGLRLWLERDITIPLVAGVTAYDVTSGGYQVKRVSLGYWLSAQGNKTPLNLLSREEYTRLSNTANNGALNSFFIDKQVSSTKVYCWMVPDATAALGTLHLIGQMRVPNFTLVADNLTVAFPQEWAIALRWGLADEICTGQPESIMARCATKAAAFKDALDAWDVEDASTKFEACVNSHSMSRFR